VKKLMLLVLLSVSTLLASNVKIENPYVRATPPHLPNSAAFMTIKNDTDKDLAIVKAVSNVSKVVELHTHDMKDGVMTMYQIPKIDISANSKTVLKPGGLHIMFIGLYKPLKVGKEVSLTVEFSNGDTQTITAPIKTVMSGMKHHGKQMDHKH
jgi:copper(I)-binding protein